MSLDFYLFTSFYFIYVCSDSWVTLDLYVSIKTTTTTSTVIGFSTAQLVCDEAFSLLPSGCMKRSVSNHVLTEGRHAVSFRFDTTFLYQSIKLKTMNMYIA